MEKVVGSRMSSRVVSVLSGKGGVGKSVIAVNLSAALSSMNVNNLLVDADLKNPTVGLHLGLSHTDVGLQDVLLGKKNLMEATVIQASMGIHAVPSTLNLKKRIVMSKLYKVLRTASGYQVIIVDSPPSSTDDVSEIINASDSVIIVTTPDIPSVVSAAKTAGMCRKAKVEVLGIAVNRSTGARYELNNGEIESMIDSRVLCRIPEDRAVPASIAYRMPVVLYAPRSKVSMELKRLAYNVSGGNSFFEYHLSPLSELLDAVSRIIFFWRK